MSKRAIRRITVSSKRQLSPHMMRIEFEGDSLADLPPECPGGYVKLLLVEDPERVDVDAVDPRAVLKRSYSIRAYDAARRTITVDFVVHDPAGPATEWARSATPGTVAIVAGPGPVKPIDPTADWVLMASDLSGLPALSANLERLPSTAVGHAIVEVPSEADRLEVPCPEGVELEWLVVPHPRVEVQPLVDRVRSVPWRNGRVSVWAAGEYNASRALRHYFWKERGLAPDDFYVSSYWKLGSTDEEHRVAKKADKAR